MVRGFTLFETMIVIGIITSIFIVGLQVSTVFENVLAARGARQVESVLGTAAQRARSGVGGTNWGVYFSYDDTTRISSKAVIFSGNSYLSRDITKDVNFPLGRNLKFSNVSLSGSSPSLGNDHEIVFTILSGSTSHYGSLTISSYTSTTQIDIPATGIATRR